MLSVPVTQLRSAFRLLLWWLADTQQSVVPWYAALRHRALTCAMTVLLIAGHDVYEDSAGAEPRCNALRLQMLAPCAALQAAAARVLSLLHLQADALAAHAYSAPVVLQAAAAQAGSV